MLSWVAFHELVERRSVAVEDLGDALSDGDLGNPSPTGGVLTGSIADLAGAADSGAFPLGEGASRPRRR